MAAFLFSAEGKEEKKGKTPDPISDSYPALLPTIRSGGKKGGGRKKEKGGGPPR